MSPIATSGPPHSRSASVNGGGPVSSTSGLDGGRMDGNKKITRAFPHLDDLTTVKPDIDINSPIRRVLQDAVDLAKQADTHFEFRRPDIALQEFIKASTIATQIIPHHKDYPSLSASQSEVNRSYVGLLKRIKAQQGRFDEVKRLIRDDNEKSGVQPKSVLSAAKDDHARSTNGSLATPDSIQNGSQFNGTKQSALPDSSTNGLTSRKRPPVQPKPDALHGKPLNPPSTAASASDQTDLASRFARLRSPTSNTPTQDPRIRTQPISIPRTVEYATSPPTTSHPATYTTTVRPLGPREMPSVPTDAPRSRPVDAQVLEMPKPPDAIYTPSRNPDTAATINFPSSVSRSSSYIGNGNNAAPPVSRVGRTPSFDDRREYFSAAHKIGDISSSNQDPILPNSTVISANDLTKYLRMGSQALRILLVDIRSREEFDEGHIMSQSIISIEPVTLRKGISSEELVESLVLSPDSEQKLFEHRHHFDLVVFYDQSSSSFNDYSRETCNTSYLQDFAKAMYDYGYDKQLKRRPVLLSGGLDAWSDLMGVASLQGSSTGGSSSTQSNTNNIKSARPRTRVQLARQPYQFPTVRKRTYESRPLSKEEESKWDETLKEHPKSHSPTSVEHEMPDELSYVRTTEDFFRRYPELPLIQESMVSARPVPQRAMYRNEPTSYVPEPPARPAPALPRQGSRGVLEKTPSGGYATSSGIGTGLTAIPASSGLTGLRNNGVSCYASSVVQCLSATGPLRNSLINFTIRPDTKVPRKTGETTDPPQLLTRNFGNLLGHMWSGKYDFVAPNTFLGYINAIHIGRMPRKSLRNHAFGGTGRQHDTSEFLMYLLEILHDETNKNRDKEDYQGQLAKLRRPRHEFKNTEDFDEQPDGDHELTSKMDTQVRIRHEWQRKLAGANSTVSNLFHGMEAHSLSCTRPGCGLVNMKFREFSVIQVPFPHKYTVLGSKEPPIPILVMLQNQFNLRELLDEAKCSKCAETGWVIQDRIITYFPDYLVIEFGRFQLVNQAGGFVSGKITAQVTFPETFDLSSIFVRSGGGSVAGDPASNRGCVGPFIYEVYAVIMHRGNDLQSGHYIAITKSLDKPDLAVGRWNRYDDQVVERTNFAECQRSGAHVTQIFLRRKQMMQQGSSL